MPGRDTFDLAASPAQLLHRAQQFAADRFAALAGDPGLTQRQFAVLAAVAAQEGLTQSGLVRATGIDRSTLAEMAARMARRGWISREKAPGDARANAVSLTAAGRKLYQAALPAASAADAAVLAVLPKGRRKDFREALTRFATAMDGPPGAGEGRMTKTPLKGGKKAKTGKKKDKKKRKK